MKDTLRLPGPSMSHSDGQNARSVIAEAAFSFEFGNETADEGDPARPQIGLGPYCQYLLTDMDIDIILPGP